MSTVVSPTPDGVVFRDIYSSDEFRISADGAWAMRDDYDWVGITADEVPEKIMRAAIANGSATANADSGNADGGK